MARVVLAMLSAPRSLRVPMARLRRAAMARGAVPVWMVVGVPPGEAWGSVLGEGDVSDVVRGIFHSPVPADRGG